MAAPAPAPASRWVAAHTHLYAGARLRLVSDTPPVVGASAIVEFADLNAVAGEIVAMDGSRLELRLPAHATARGAPIATKHWHLAPVAAEAGLYKVLGRVAGPAA